MDILAHALWAGAGVMLARQQGRPIARPLTRRTAALTVALAAAPDIPHLLPIVGWSVLGGGDWTIVTGYANALPGQEPAVPAWVHGLSHNLHCFTHSAIVAGLVTLLVYARTGALWVPLLGWWSHIVIDVFTHSQDYYPSPVFWPITRAGFDGLAWNTPWFMGVNYAALAATYAWLLWRRRRARSAFSGQHLPPPPPA